MSLFLRFLFHFFSLSLLFLLSLYFIWVFWFCSDCILYDRYIVDAHMKINFKIHVKTHVARDILVLIRLLTHVNMNILVVFDD